VITPTDRLVPDNTQHPAGFETAVPARERPQTHRLDRAATGIGEASLVTNKM